MNLGDHKLDRQYPLLPVLRGFPVHITQNIASRLGLANGSTETTVGYQFPRDTVFKSMSFQEYPTRLASSLLKLFMYPLTRHDLKIDS